MKAEHKQLLSAVAERIKRNPTQFSTEDTAYGIEGWTLRAAHRRFSSHIDTYTEAAKLLGLTRKRADLLFIDESSSTMDRNFVAER